MSKTGSLCPHRAYSLVKEMDNTDSYRIPLCPQEHLTQIWGRVGESFLKEVMSKLS